MARPASATHSPSSDHELLLRDFQGQENDHERQDEDVSSAGNDKISQDGGIKQGVYMYPRWLAGRNPEAHPHDIKAEHRDHHISTFDIGGTKKVSPYPYSGPLLHGIEEVRRFVYIRLIVPPSHSPPPTELPC